MSGPFSDDERFLLTSLPVKVAEMMAGIDDTGRLGLTKEMIALSRELTEAANRFPGNTIIDAALPDFNDDVKTAEATRDLHKRRKRERTAETINTPLDRRAHTVLLAHRVDQLLRDKADQVDGAEYRQWVVGVGRRVAEAAKAGGFLSRESVVSEGERRALSEIAEALGADGT